MNLTSNSLYQNWQNNNVEPLPSVVPPVLIRRHYNNSPVVPAIAPFLYFNPIVASLPFAFFPLLGPDYYNSTGSLNLSDQIPTIAPAIYDGNIF
jgi:hypothetical protein